MSKAMRRPFVDQLRLGPIVRDDSVVMVIFPVFRSRTRRRKCGRSRTRACLSRVTHANLEPSGEMATAPPRTPRTPGGRSIRRPSPNKRWRSVTARVTCAAKAMRGSYDASIGGNTREDPQPNLILLHLERHFFGGEQKPIRKIGLDQQLRAQQLRKVRWVVPFRLCQPWSSKRHD